MLSVAHVDNADCREVPFLRQYVTHINKEFITGAAARGRACTILNYPYRVGCWIAIILRPFSEASLHNNQNFCFFYDAAAAICYILLLLYCLCSISDKFYVIHSLLRYIIIAK